MSASRCAGGSCASRGRRHPASARAAARSPGLLEGVQQPLDVGLLAAVGAGRPAMGRPGLVDRPVLGAGRVGAHRRGVDQRRHLGLPHRLKDPAAADHVDAPGGDRVVGGLEEPGKVDDDVGAAEARHQVVAAHVRGGPLGLGRLPCRQAAGQAQHGADRRLLGQRLDQAGPDVPGGPNDNDSHALRLPPAGGRKPGGAGPVPGRSALVRRHRVVTPERGGDMSQEFRQTVRAEASRARGGPRRWRVGLPAPTGAEAEVGVPRPVERALLGRCRGLAPRWR
jgi:hypothetical protein